MFVAFHLCLHLSNLLALSQDLHVLLIGLRLKLGKFRFVLVDQGLGALATH